MQRCWDCHSVERQEKPREEQFRHQIPRRSCFDHFYLFALLRSKTMRVLEDKGREAFPTAAFDIMPSLDYVCPAPSGLLHRLGLSLRR